jgi:GNAT superfamily N-acetyltransferase
MEATIREARPDDAAFLAWVMLAAARSHRPLSFWDHALPGPEAPRLETIADMVTAEPRNFSNYDGFLIAEADGKPLGGLSAYDSKEKSLENFTTALAGGLVNREWSSEHMELLYHRIGPATSCMPDSPEGVWVIEWVALTPEARGKGIARKLLEAILDRGRQAGYTDAQIGFLIGNDPARTAYERVGFTAVEELRDPSFEAALGSPGITRMTRKL